MRSEVQLQRVLHTDTGETTGEIVPQGRPLATERRGDGDAGRVGGGQVSDRASARAEEHGRTYVVLKLLF